MEGEYRSRLAAAHSAVKKRLDYQVFIVTIKMVVNIIKLNDIVVALILIIIQITKMTNR